MSKRKRAEQADVEQRADVAQRAYVATLAPWSPN